MAPHGTQTLTEATLTPDESTRWTSPVTGKTYVEITSGK